MPIEYSGQKNQHVEWSYIGASLSIPRLLVEQGDIEVVLLKPRCLIIETNQRIPVGRQRQHIPVQNDQQPKDADESPHEESGRLRFELAMLVLLGDRIIWVGTQHGLGTAKRSCWALDRCNGAYDCPGKDRQRWIESLQRQINSMSVRAPNAIRIIGLNRKFRRKGAKRGDRRGKKLRRTQNAVKYEVLATSDSLISAA